MKVLQCLQNRDYDYLVECSEQEAADLTGINWAMLKPVPAPAGEEKYYFLISRSRKRYFMLPRVMPAPDVDIGHLMKECMADLRYGGTFLSTGAPTPPPPPPPIPNPPVPRPPVKETHFTPSPPPFKQEPPVSLEEILEKNPGIDPDSVALGPVPGGAYAIRAVVGNHVHITVYDENHRPVSHISGYSGNN